MTVPTVDALSYVYNIKEIMYASLVYMYDVMLFSN